MCVFVCMCKYVSIHACVCKYMRRSEADIGDQRLTLKVKEVGIGGQRLTPFVFLTLGFETDSLTEPGVP